MPERFAVQLREADQRLDKLLRQRFPALSFGQTQKLIRSGRVRVDGRRAKARDPVPAGAMVTLPYQGQDQGQETALPPAHAALAKLRLYGDDSLVAIDKPAGLAVQGGTLVKTHVAGLIAGTDLRLVHRLDRETSGLLLLGQGALNAKVLTRAFARQEVEKTYLAVVPRVDRQAGTLTFPLKKALVGGEGRRVIASPQTQGAQMAVTDFEVLGRSAAGVLLRLAPRTGRTHQLRVHCAQAFGGIFGDSKYGAAQDRASRLLLHAWRLQLAHPETGEALALEAALPPAYVQALETLRLSLPETWSPL